MQGDLGQKTTNRTIGEKESHMEKRRLKSQKNSPSFRRFGESGFTMVELIVTLIFIGIALTALLSSFSTSVVKSTDSETLTLAVELAEAKLEQIQSDKSGRGFPYIVSENYPDETNPDGYEGYTRQVRIMAYQDYKEVTVSVSHPEMETVSISTIVANY